MSDDDTRQQDDRSAFDVNLVEALMQLPLRVRLQWDWIAVLVRTVWGEARGQSFEGMVAVACVIMNRSLKNTWYGRTPMDVCLKRWQFSCWNAGDPNLQKMNNLRPGDSAWDVKAYLAVMVAARIAGTEHDPSMGATHYHVHEMDPHPSWAFVHEDGRPTKRKIEPKVVIGDHAFYDNID